MQRRIALTAESSDDDARREPPVRGAVPATMEAALPAVAAAVKPVNVAPDATSRTL